MVNADNPLISDPPKEVPLKNAPLVRVIAQVRFPPILSIEKKEFVGSFQEAIRERYPILQTSLTHSVVQDSQGAVVQVLPQVTWRFIDTTDNWRVSLAPSFVALETTAYLSRRDFLERLESLLVALNESFNPQIIERFGLRYIDRLVKQEMEDASDLVRAEIAGLTAADFGEYLRHTVNESLFVMPDGGEQIIGRWGLLSPGATYDADALEPIAEPSWILDLDMALQKNQEFSVKAVMGEAQRFAERIYTFFRWAVTDEFLRRFGGEP